MDTIDTIKKNKDTYVKNAKEITQEQKMDIQKVETKSIKILHGRIGIQTNRKCTWISITKLNSVSAKIYVLANF